MVDADGHQVHGHDAQLADGEGVDADVLTLGVQGHLHYRDVLGRVHQGGGDHTEPVGVELPVHGPPVRPGWEVPSSVGCDRYGRTRYPAPDVHVRGKGDTGPDGLALYAMVQPQAAVDVDVAVEVAVHRHGPHRGEGRHPDERGSVVRLEGEGLGVDRGGGVARHDVYLDRRNLVEGHGALEGHLDGPELYGLAVAAVEPLPLEALSPGPGRHRGGAPQVDGHRAGSGQRPYRGRFRERPYGRQYVLGRLGIDTVPGHLRDGVGLGGVVHLDAHCVAVDAHDVQVDVDGPVRVCLVDEPSSDGGVDLAAPCDHVEGQVARENVVPVVLEIARHLVRDDGANEGEVHLVDEDRFSGRLVAQLYHPDVIGVGQDPGRMPLVSPDLEHALDGKDVAVH